MTISKPVIEFLREQGELSQIRFKESGKPTPKPVLDVFKLLSMIEVLLPEDISEEQLKRLENIVDFKF